MMIRTAVLCAALASPLAADGVGDMSADERATFREEVRAYLLENPEVLMEAIAVLEERQAADQAQDEVSMVADNRDALMNDASSWSGGNPDGDITLVEFIDYRCGYCRRAHDEVAELIESDGNIRIVVKEFPILGDASIASSRFALAAREIAGDDAYKSVADALIALRADPSEDVLRRLAETLELDADAIMAEMGSDRVTEIIETNRALAQRMQITGTPTFVLQDRMLRGYVPLEQMRLLVEDVREG